MRLRRIRGLVETMFKVDWMRTVSAQVRRLVTWQSRFIRVTTHTFWSTGSAMSLAHIVWIVPLSPLVPMERLKPLLDITSPNP